MYTSAPIRFAAAASLAFSTLLPAQSLTTAPAKPSAATAVSTLPATPPTTAPAVLPISEQHRAHPATITYANGLLTVSASNSSLNQILRDVSHETGMKITGGVLDERVFGEYGPAPATQVLNTLLDGTGSNVLLVQGNGPAPAELILTPRNGGPTPPSADTVAPEEPEQRVDLTPKQSFRSGRPVVMPPSSAPVNEGSSVPQDSTQTQSPNGVKTPQEIYNQLQKLHQQQQQSTPQ